MKIKNHSVTADEYVINSHLISYMTAGKLNEDDIEKVIEILNEMNKEEKHDVLRKIQNEDNNYSIGDLLNE